MAKVKKGLKDVPAGRTKRVKLTAEESLKRMQEFGKRKEQFVAAVRKAEGRGVVSCDA
jgi:hypothetical protein